ncbi:MAG: hypothetical protein WC250_01405 [Candidatus Paceibacterota bacterium]|jgi:hypothetical protein
MFKNPFENFGQIPKRPEKIESNRDDSEFYERRLRLTAEIEALVKEEITLNTKIRDIETGREPNYHLYDEGEKDWLASNPSALLEEYRLRRDEIKADLAKLREELK